MKQELKAELAAREVVAREAAEAREAEAKKRAVHAAAARFVAAIAITGLIKKDDCAGSPRSILALTWSRHTASTFRHHLYLSLPQH